MDGKLIIDAMLLNYRRCTSYEDAGEVLELIKYSDREQVNVGHFSTTFVRPDLLKFEMRMREFNNQRRFVLQSDGEAIRSLEVISGPSRDDTTSVRAYDNFEASLQTVAGQTKGITSLNFSLIGALPKSRQFHEVNTIIRDDDDTVDGILCYKIVSQIDPFAGVVATTWISASDFSLRKYQLDTVFSEQFLVAAKHSARQLAKAEGYAYDAKNECVGFVHTFNFLETTFNNSTNIDRITTEFS